MAPGAGRAWCWRPAAAAASSGHWPRDSCWRRPSDWHARCWRWRRCWPLAAVPAIVRGRCRLAAIFALGSLAAAAWCWAHHEQDRVTESLHGQLEVRTSPLATTLLIDGLPQTGLPRRLAPGDALEYGYLLELSLAMRPGTKTALVVGLGGGLAPKILGMHGVRCRSIELDPAVVDIARREFQFQGDAILGDARAVLARDETRYDLIFLDACTADRLPWHLFTLEAMRLWRSRLSADGILVIQFIGDDGPWSASLVQTVTRAFGPGRCTLLAPAADRGPVGPRWLFVGRDRLPQPPGRSAGPARAASWRPRELPDDGLLLTDDHFAAELAWARDSPPLAEHLQRKTVDRRAGGGSQSMSQSSGIFSPPAMVSIALSTLGSMSSLRHCTEPSSIPTLATPGCLLRMHLVEKSLILKLISSNFRSSRLHPGDAGLGHFHQADRV